MKRKFLTLFLALAASVGTIFAETGTCGPNATWEWTEDGVLAIEGSGEMYDYTSSPWATSCKSSFRIRYSKWSCKGFPMGVFS